MSRRKIRFAWLWLSALVGALSSTTVQAGRVELLDGVTLATIILRPKGVFNVGQLGDMPKLISDVYRVRCLHCRRSALAFARVS